MEQGTQACPGGFHLPPVHRTEEARAGGEVDRHLNRVHGPLECSLVSNRPEDVQHRRVVPQRLGHESIDAAFSGQSGQLLKEERSDASSVLIVGNYERRLGATVLTVTEEQPLMVKTFIGCDADQAAVHLQDHPSMVICARPEKPRDMAR
jgi:hypothetical protein